MTALLVLAAITSLALLLYLLAALLVPEKLQ